MGSAFKRRGLSGLSGFKVKTAKQVRDLFWMQHPEFQSEFSPKKRQKDYRADIRIAFVDFIERLSRDGIISVSLSEKITL